VIHLGQLCAAAFAENVVASSGIGRQKITHVLDDSENGNGDRLEHSERPPHIGDSDVLRSRHEHCALNGNKLGQRQLYVASARRHVNDQIIKLAPFHIRKKLFHQPVQDRPAHDHNRLNCSTPIPRAPLKWRLAQGATRIMVSYLTFLFSTHKRALQPAIALIPRGPVRCPGLIPTIITGWRFVPGTRRSTATWTPTTTREDRSYRAGTDRGPESR